MDYVPAECISTTLELARAFNGSGFIFEEKHDGIRAIVQTNPAGNLVTGRRFLNSKPAEIVKSHAAYLRAAQLPFSAVLDGELMPDGRFMVFDLLALHGQDLRQRSQGERKHHLRYLAPHFPEFVELVSWRDSIPSEFGEGVVIKDLQTRYGYGWWKAKRVETDDVTVLGFSEIGTAIVQGGSRIVVPESVREGDTIEVEFFKRFESGRFRNGRFLRIRDDKNAACDYSRYERVSASR